MKLNDLLSGVVLACIALPTLANEPMTGAQFERYTMGRTYTFGHPGVAPYGIELYRPNRQVTWAVFSDVCVDGYWYDTPENEICFVYDDNPIHKCWLFFKQVDTLTADFVGDPNDLEYEVVQTSASMPCLGPMVGV